MKHLIFAWLLCLSAIKAFGKQIIIATESIFDEIDLFAGLGGPGRLGFLDLFRRDGFSRLFRRDDILNKRNSTTLIDATGLKYHKHAMTASGGDGGSVGIRSTALGLYYRLIGGTDTARVGVVDMSKPAGAVLFGLPPFWQTRPNAFRDQAAAV